MGSRPNPYADLLADLGSPSGAPVRPFGATPRPRASSYDDLTADLGQPQPEEESLFSKYATPAMAARIGAPILGGIAGSLIAPGPGTLAGIVSGAGIGAAVGGGLGELGAQALEDRPADYGEAAIAAGLSAIPAGPIARAIKPGMGLLARGALHAGEGAAQSVLDTGAQTLYHEGRLPTAGEIGGGMVAGSVLGGGLGLGLERAFRPRVNEIPLNLESQGNSVQPSAPSMPRVQPEIVDMDFVDDVSDLVPEPSLDLRFSPQAQTGPPTQPVTAGAPIGASQPIGTQNAQPDAPAGERRVATERSELESILSGLPSEQQAILRAQLRQLQTEADTDPLTGLMGRRAWDKRQASLTPASRVISLDLKGFKSLNDTVGHSNADEGLKAVGSLMSKHFGQGNAARTMGDEFFGVLDNVPDAEIPARIEAFRADLGQLRVSVQMPDGTVIDLPRLEAHIGYGETAEAADLAANAARRVTGSGRVTEVPGGDPLESGAGSRPEGGGQDPEKQLAPSFKEWLGDRRLPPGDVAIYKAARDEYLKAYPQADRDQFRPMAGPRTAEWQAPQSNAMTPDEAAQSAAEFDARVRELVPDETVDQDLREVVRPAFASPISRAMGGSVKPELGLEHIGEDRKAIVKAIDIDGDNPLYLKIKEARRLELADKAMEFEGKGEAYEPKGIVDDSFDPADFETPGAPKFAVRPSPGQRGLSGIGEDVPQRQEQQKKAPQQTSMFGGQMLQGVESRTTEGREGDGPLFAKPEEPKPEQASILDEPKPYRPDFVPSNDSSEKIAAQLALIAPQKERAFSHGNTMRGTWRDHRLSKGEVHSMNARMHSEVKSRLDWIGAQFLDGGRFTIESKEGARWEGVLTPEGVKWEQIGYRDRATGKTLPFTKFAVRDNTGEMSPKGGPGRDDVPANPDEKPGAGEEDAFHVSPESHLDHGVSDAHIAFARKHFAGRKGFFAETVTLPDDLAALQSALHGPLAGDPPLAESDVFYSKRGQRQYESRLTSRPPRASRKMTVIAGPDESGKQVLYTAFGGELSPQEALDPGVRDRPASEKFWREHALSVPRDENFKRWFGDSKIVSGDGEPTVLYHGTREDFDTFQPGAPIYLTPSLPLAEVHAGTRGKVLPLFAAIRNPLRLPARELDGLGYSPKRIAALRQQGYDGVVAHDGSQVIAFDPAQVKSATENRGTYDPTKPNIKLRASDPTSKPSVDAQTVKRAFPSGKVIPQKDGSIRVELPNGSKIRVDRDANIVPDAETLLKDHPDAVDAEGNLLPGMGITGSFTPVGRDGIIALAKEGGDEFTLRHESFHAAMHMALSKKEIAAVLKKYGDEETASDAYAAWTPKQVNSWFSKIYAFAQRIYRAFKPSWESAFERTASGEAFGKRAEIPARQGSKLATAYHGSPHDFDRFELSDKTIGTGEGAQAYGHGLYFAGKKEVAQHYRDKLSGAHGAVPGASEGRSKWLVNGQERPSGIGGHAALDTAQDIDGLLYYIKDGRAEMADYIRGQIEGRIERFRKTDSGTVNTADGDMRALADFYERHVKNAGPDSVTERPKGRLYEVDLSPSEDEYLLWDKPLSEQSEKVKAALKNVPLESVGLEVSPAPEVGPGFSWLQVKGRGRLGSVRGTPKSLGELGDYLSTSNWMEAVKGPKASAALRDAGVPGVKYLDGQSRNKPLSDIKRAFLGALPQNAEIDDVRDAIGTARFTPEQNAVLRALDADGWLGFDYPAQAISAVYGKDAANFEMSPALKSAVEATLADASYNYVLFDDKLVKVKAKYATRKQESRTDPPNDAKPIRAYHGTRAKFDEFQSGNAEAYGKGVYFATNPKGTEEFSFGGRVVEADVYLKNPWNGDNIPPKDLGATKAWREKFIKVWHRDDWKERLEEPDRDGVAGFPEDAFEELPTFRNEVLRELGYDGVIVPNDEYGNEVVVFDPKNVRVVNPDAKVKYATRPNPKAQPETPDEKGEGFGQPGGEPDMAPNVNRMNVPDSTRAVAQRTLEDSQSGLKRETKQTFESLDPEIAKIQKTMSDAELIRLSEKRQLDSAEVMALKQRVDQKAREFDDALSSGDAKKIGAKALDMVASARALANDGTDTARALNARKRLMDAGTTVDDRFLRRVFKEIPSVTDADAANLLLLYKTDPAKLPDALIAAMKPGILRRWINVWKAGLLSAPSTDVAQIIGNSSEAAVNIIEGAISAGADKIISRLTGKPRERFLGEARAELAGLIESFGPAMKQLKSDMVDVHKLKPAKIDVDDPRPLEQQVGAFTGKLGKFSQTPYGRNTAEDRAFKSVGAAMALRKLAFRQAKGNEALAKQLVREALEQGRHPDLIEAAGKIARERVFQDEPGQAIQYLDRMAREFPALEFVIPFRNTPERIAARTISRSPLGFVAGKNSTLKVAKRFKAGEATSGELADSIARPMLGTLILGGFAAAAKAGLMTGSGPVDEKQKAALRDSGWSPYSFKIPKGDGKFLYVPFNRFEPVSSLLGVAADFAEAGNESEAQDILSKGLNSLGSNLISKSYLQGLADAAGVISRPDQALATYATEFVGSQVPNIVRRAATAIDPVVRDTKAERTGLAGLPERAAKTVASRIPFVSETLPARKTQTGQDMERSGALLGPLERFASPAITSSERDDRSVERLLARIGGDALPATPKKAITARGREVKLTDEEYDVLLSGNREATKIVERMMKRGDFQRLPDSEADARGKASKEKLIEAVYRREREKARRKVLNMRSFRQRALQA